MGKRRAFFSFAEVLLNEIAQHVEGAVHGEAQLTSFPHGDDRHHTWRFHGFADLIRAFATICKQNGRLGQVVGYDHIDA